ncbi:hypothetical protein JW711_02580 [Candidatus Woesearchaeota archaeon]|nr:hypothetical protein [Candidatus Woesearchaeota archaeon]
MEFLLVIGFALLMSLPLIFIFYKQSETLNTEVAESQVDKIANTIRDAADEVYYLGAPSKKTLKIYMPKNVLNITIMDNKIIFNVTSPNGNYEVVKWSAANFTSASEISPGPGVKNIVLEAQTFQVDVSDY